MPITKEQASDLLAATLLNAIYMKASQVPAESGTFAERVIAVRDDVLEEFEDLSSVLFSRRAKR